MQNSQQLLEKVRKLIDAEQGPNLDSKEDVDLVIQKYVIPSLNSNKDILKNLYFDFYPGRSGLLAFLKKKVIGKIANVTRNTVEHSMMRQQKFNDSVAFLLAELIKENIELRKELSKKK